MSEMEHGLAGTLAEAFPVRAVAIDDRAHYGETPARQVHRDGHAAAEPEIGQIAPRLALDRVQRVATLNAAPVKREGAVEASPVIGIERAKTLPAALPAAPMTPQEAVYCFNRAYVEFAARISIIPKGDQVAQDRITSTFAYLRQMIDEYEAASRQ